MQCISRQQTDVWKREDVRALNDIHLFSSDCLSYNPPSQKKTKIKNNFSAEIAHLEIESNEDVLLSSSTRMTDRVKQPLQPVPTSLHGQISCFKKPRIPSVRIPEAHLVNLMKGADKKRTSSSLCLMFWKVNLAFQC